MGSGADAWIVVPVENHRSLVERVASAKGFSVSDTALGRTSVLYLGVYPERSCVPAAAEDDSAAVSRDSATDVSPAGAPEVRLLATGSFPRSASSVVFPKSRGWERAGSDSGVTWYRSGSMGAAIPRSGLFAMARDFPALLSNLSRSDIAPVSVPAEFESYLESPALDGRVAFMAASPSACFSGLLPVGMTLPVDYALFFASRQDGVRTGVEGTYSLTGYLQARDVRSARAVAALLKLATGSLQRTPGSGPRIQGTRVYLEEWTVDTDTLAAFAGF